MSSKTRNAPAKPKTWADISPAPIRPYVQLTRIDKFAGSMLVFWPCAWGLTMAAKNVNLSPVTFAIEVAAFFVGSVILHSAACVINDICDIDFDRQVERTKNRPLAAGTVSVPAAWIFLLAQVGICLWFLSFTNDLAFKVGLIGLFPFHSLYPLMKRITYWPQAWLGIAMNWGLPVSWVAITGSLDYNVLGAFMFGTFLWTIYYDTGYAYQDKKDDAKAGVKSTALLFGDNGRPILSLFAAGFISCLAYAGSLNDQGTPFYLISVGGGALYMLWQLVAIDFESPPSCWEFFHSNGNLGYVIWAGMLVDYYQKSIAV